MTIQLRVALYVEGNDDRNFLPAIVRQTLLSILAKDQQTKVDILEPEIIEIPKGLDRETAILRAAEKAAHHDILIIHSDVDKRSWEEAYSQSIEPGLKAVEKARLESNDIKFCERLVPLLPNHMLESWILADAENLRRVLGTRASVEDLGIPKLKEIERRANPKKILEEAVAIAIQNRPKRQRKQPHISKILYGIYSRMGAEINLDLLEQLPSYQKFVQALTNTLKDLDVIR